MSRTDDASTGVRVLYVGASERRCGEIRELVRALAPSAQVECRAALPPASPAADLVVIEDGGSSPAADQLAHLRGVRHAGAVLVLAEGQAPAIVDDLHRAGQLVAAGQIALKLQHSLNNPLAALLAEAQLLEMEPLADEHRGAATRMVQLCRRMVAIVRELDSVKGAGASR